MFIRPKPRVSLSMKLTRLLSNDSREAEAATLKAQNTMYTEGVPRYTAASIVQLI